MSKVAFCFPGQGSQRVGMGRDFVAQFPEAAAVFDEASEELDFDLRKVCFEGPIEELSQTEVTQPALVASSLAAFRAIQERLGVKPDVVVGHSVGEYAAIAAADSVGVGVVTRLVRERGLAMAASKARGAMAAILGLEAGAVIEGCMQAADDLGTIVQAANFNDPKQTVIAGTKAGVDKACELLKAAGAKRALLLAVSAPFHSALMKPAADRLRERLVTTPIDAPFIPVIDNIDVRSESEPAAIRDALYRQAFGAVRWVETIKALRARGIHHIFECGPGRVLAGMVKRIEPDAVSAAVSEPESLAAAAALLR